MTNTYSKAVSLYSDITQLHTSPILIKICRSFPLPVSFCVASQKHTFPVLETIRHKASIKLIQATLHCMFSLFCWAYLKPFSDSPRAIQGMSVWHCPGRPLGRPRRCLDECPAKWDSKHSFDYVMRMVLTQRNLPLHQHHSPRHIMF